MSRLLAFISKMTGNYQGPPAVRAFWSHIPQPDSRRLAEIKRAIEMTGAWEQQVEWRISTIASSRIEPFVDDQQHEWFRVSVECGHVFTCLCPTIKRAAEFESIYRTLIVDLFYFRGWPGWASKTQLQPDDH